MIYRSLAEKYHWTREQVNELTMRDIRIYLSDEKELKDFGELPRTKVGMKSMEKTFMSMALNLVSDRRWDAS